MKTLILSATMLLATMPVRPAACAPAREAQASHPVTVESYYRVKWGSEAEFKQLYTRNEAALLLEMQRMGFITTLHFDEPFTHFPGEGRWTLRATIVYRDAPAAVETGGGWDEAWEAARKRLLPDKKTYDAEETRRFSLMEDHWDVIVTPFEPKP